MSNSNRVRRAVQKRRDQRAGMPPIPSDATDEQRQFFQALLDNLSVRMGQSGSDENRAATVKELRKAEDSNGPVIVSGGGSSGGGDDTAGYLDGLTSTEPFEEGDYVLTLRGGEYLWVEVGTVDGGDGGGDGDQYEPPDLNDPVVIG